MNRFTTNPDGTVTDTKLGLVWSKTLMDGKDRPYDEAKAAVEGLGADWRMPTIEELLTLVDRTRYSPAIDTEVFPDTKSTWYWSSTPVAWHPAAVWVVNFGSGGSYDFLRNFNACVRAVRSAPVGQ
jgi:hypothetical protein